MASSLQHTLKVDDDVWVAIESLATPFVDKSPNDVLRRVLVTDANKPAPRSVIYTRKPGALMKAIENGTIQPDDELVCDQPRRHRTFRARVTADGWIKVIDPELEEYNKPSPALAACTGGQINGWGNWVHQPTGHILQEFRH